MTLPAGEVVACAPEEKPRALVMSFGRHAVRLWATRRPADRIS